MKGNRFNQLIERLESLLAPRVFAMAACIGAFLAGTAGGGGEPSSLFVVTNSMTQARENATATLLPRGKVLVTGGQDSVGTVQASAELYDPATGRFNFVTVMSIPRKLHTAMLLNNGKVLIAGGIDAKGNVLNSAEIFDPATLTFTLLTNTMTDSRAAHIAKVLPNGQVLIAGGQDANGTVNTAEIYDPASSQFICVGGVSASPPACSPSMTDSRQGHTATLLNDGTVLLTGGKNNAGNITSTAERFFPAATTNAGAGVFRAAGQMSDARLNHTATLLSNGTVLIAGGTDGLDIVPTAEIYDPSSGSFHPTASPVGGVTTMTTPRQNHTATALSDGRVLIVGGTDNTGSFIASGELYNPAGGVFTAVASQMAVARASHTANLLGNGLVLVAGGGAPSVSPLVVNEAELFDPAPGFFVPSGNMTTSRQFATASTLFTGPAIVVGGQSAIGPLASSEFYSGTTFTRGPNMSTARSFHTATTFPKFLNPSCACNDQLVLFAGGVDGAGKVHSDADVYEVFLGVMTQSVPGGFPLNQMSHPRLGHTSTLLLVSGEGLYTGGMTSDGSVLNNADIFNPAGGAFQASAGTMVSSRVFHTASQLLDGTVLLAGGRDTNGNILNTAELYNPVADSFVAVPNSMNDAREFHTATVLNTGQVLIAGGLDSNGASATAEIYNSTTKTFTPVGRMLTARYFHSAVLMPDGQVLIAGGEGNGKLVVSEAELYNPLTATFTPAPDQMLSPRFGQIATMLQSGLVLLAGGADGGFNVTASSELYDPPAGPQPAGALISVSKRARVTGVPNSAIDAGHIQAINLSGTTETFTGLRFALSNPAIFSRLVLSGKSANRVASMAVRNPGSTATFSFGRPLTVAPGGSVTFTLTGVLGPLRRAGGSPGHSVRSVQTATEIGASKGSGTVQVMGLPAGLGVVTLR